MTTLKEKLATSNVVNNQGDFEEWSDRQCILKSVKDNFPINVKDTNVQKKIISGFLNFYLSGKIPKGLTVGDLVFAVIAIMPESFESEEFIFQDYNYSEEGTLFFLTPEHKIQAEIKSMLNNRSNDQEQQMIEKEEQENSIIKGHNYSSECNVDSSKGESYETDAITEMGVAINTEIEDCYDIISTNEKDDCMNEFKAKNTMSDSQHPFNNLGWYRKKRFSHFTQLKTTYEYGANENAAFCISCNSLLSKWHENTRARTELKYFFAMTGLILLRGTVKTYQNLNNFFTYEFSKHISNTTIKYSIPHKAFIKKGCKTFRMLDNKTQIMFSKLVVTSFECCEKLKNFYKNNILRFAVLSHTADFGMGIISMLQIVASNAFNFALVFEILNSNMTAKSWHTVHTFIKKNMCPSSKQYTYHWARIIDNKQFKYLSCNDNYAFAVVLAVFIEKLTDDPGIWQSVWVKEGEDVDTYKELGLEMYRQYKNRVFSVLYDILGTNEETD